jgi:heme A synthase
MDGHDVLVAVLTGLGVLTVAAGMTIWLGLGPGLVAGGALILAVTAVLVRLDLYAAVAVVPDDESEAET